MYAAPSMTRKNVGSTLLSTKTKSKSRSNHLENRCRGIVAPCSTPERSCIESGSAVPCDQRKWAPTDRVPSYPRTDCLGMAFEEEEGGFNVMPYNSECSALALLYSKCFCNAIRTGICSPSCRLRRTEASGWSSSWCPTVSSSDLSRWIAGTLHRLSTIWHSFGFSTYEERPLMIGILTAT